MNFNYDFEISTWNSIKEFNNFFNEIKEKYPNLTMPMIRNYIKTGTKIVGVPNELYDDIDKLFAIRLKAIEIEKIHLEAQAEKAGKKLPESILNGKNLKPYFEDEVYEIVPTLKIFEFMVFYDGEEIANMKNKTNIEVSQNSTDERE